jgi:uncharacterized protein DUF4112
MGKRAKSLPDRRSTRPERDESSAVSSRPAPASSRESRASSAVVLARRRPRQLARRLRYRPTLTVQKFFHMPRWRRLPVPSDGRQRRRSAPSDATPALWQRGRSLLVSLWQPRRAVDAALPSWVHVLVGLSDDGLRVPGTRVRLGLDALLGTLLPGAGDALGGVTAAMLMYVAWRRGAPPALLYKMLGNAAVDIGVGSIPIIGDVFDLGFHANRRNLDLLEAHLKQRAKPSRASRLSLLLAFLGLGLLILLVLAGLVALFVFGWRELGR